MRVRAILGRTALILALGTMLPLVGAGAANAASSTAQGGSVVAPNAVQSTSCVVKVEWFTTSCKTGTIHANGSAHRIKYRMCAAPHHYADWQIKDAHNGVIVAQGRVEDAVCTSDTVTGLFGDYWAWVFNTRDNASAYIDNS